MNCGDKREKNKRKKGENIGSHSGLDKRSESGKHSASTLSARLGLFLISPTMSEPREVKDRPALSCAGRSEERRATLDPAIRSDGPVPVDPPTFCFGAEHAPLPQQLPDQPENPRTRLSFQQCTMQEARLARHKHRSRIGDAVILPSVAPWLLCVAGEQCYCGGCSKHCHAPPQGQSRPNVERARANKRWGSQPAKELGALSCPNRNCRAAC